MYKKNNVKFIISNPVHKQIYAFSKKNNDLKLFNKERSKYSHMSIIQSNWIILKS